MAIMTALSATAERSKSAYIAARYGLNCSQGRPLGRWKTFGWALASPVAAELGAAVRASRWLLGLDPVPARRFDLAPAGYSDGTVCYMAAADPARGGGGRDNIPTIARRVMGLLANKEVWYSKKDIIERYNIDFRPDQLTDDFYNRAVEILVREKRVIADGSNNIRFYNQEEAIRQASLELSRKLVGVDSLHELASTAETALAGLFGNIDLYFKDGSSGQMLIVSGARDASSFRQWRPVDSGGLYDVLFKSPEERLRFLQNIGEAVSESGPIFSEEMGRCRERFQNPGQVLYCVGTGSASSDSVALKVHEWALKGSGPNKYFYSENPEVPREAVNSAIEDLVLVIERKMREIVSRSSQAGVLSLQQRWDKEQTEIDAAATATSRAETESVPRGFDLEQEKRFWGSYARVMHVFLGSRDHRKIAEEVSSQLHLNPEETIVFAGCGIGNDILEFQAILGRERVDGLRLKGFDLSPVMIEKAKADTRLTGCEFTEHDWCERLSYDDNSIDKIASLLVFGYLAKPLKALAETLRVLNPGGIVSLAVPTAKYNATLLFLRGVLHSFRDRGWKQTGKDLPYGFACLLYMWKIKHKIKKGLYRGYDVAGLTAIFQQAGFQDVTAFPSAGGRDFTVVSARKPAPATQLAAA